MFALPSNFKGPSGRARRVELAAMHLGRYIL